MAKRSASRRASAAHATQGTTVAAASGAGRARILAVCLGLVLLNVLIYAQTRHHPFINFDDPQYVAENRYVAGGLTLGGVRWAFTTTHAGNWHPLTWISHMIDAELFGLGAGRHHLANAGWHILNTLLLFGVLIRLTGAFWRPAFVAALFAAHPTHVESVAWIAERKDVLSGVFWLLAMWAYARYAAAPSPARYALVALALAAGLMAKPMLVTLPFALLLLDWWPLRRFETLPARRLIVEKLPLIALAASSSVITFVVQREAGAVRPIEALGIGRRIGAAIAGYAEYLWKLVWPVDLALLYPHPAELPVVVVALSVLLLIALTAGALWSARRAPYVTLGWLWFLGTLVPVIGLVQVGSQRIADRYTYIPYIGLFLIAAWGARALAARWRVPPAAIAAAAAVVLAAHTALAHAQTARWRSSVSIWEHTLRVTTANARAHNHLGHALALEGRHQEAIAQYEEALRLHPRYAEALNNLGQSLERTGRDSMAIVRYREAIGVNDRLAEAHSNLGALLAERGHVGEAFTALERAVALEPHHTTARANLAVLLARTGRSAEALEAFAEIVRLEPGNADARRHMAVALAMDGRYEDAIREGREALRLAPGDALTHNALGAALGRMGRETEALVHYQEAVRLQPEFAEARANLGATLLSLGRPADAVPHLQRSLALDPRQPDVRYALATALLESDRLPDALDELERLLTDYPDHAEGRALLMSLAERTKGR
jgi:protein O-mannosyl-transferase